MLIKKECIIPIWCGIFLNTTDSNKQVLVLPQFSNIKLTIMRWGRNFQIWFALICLLYFYIFRSSKIYRLFGKLKNNYGWKLTWYNMQSCRQPNSKLKMFAFGLWQKNLEYFPKEKWSKSRWGWYYSLYLSTLFIFLVPRLKWIPLNSQYIRFLVLNVTVFSPYFLSKVVF